MSNLINSKIFKLAFFSLILAEVLSFWGWKFTLINSICFWALAALILILSLKKLEYGLYFIFAELFVGSFGYLFSFNFGGTKISLRLMLFLVVMGVWFTQSILRRPAHGTTKDPVANEKNNINNHPASPPAGGSAPLLEKPARRIGGEGMVAAIVFAGILLLSFLQGILRGHGFANTFLDFNNWLYFLLILPITQIYTNKNTNQHKFFIENILSILAAASLFLSLKTLFLFYIFSHADSEIWATAYKFIRDTLSGEVTHVSSNIFRVFIQSQIYLLIFFFVWLSNSKPKIQNKSYSFFIFHYSLLILPLAALIVSFSRSFWAGLGVGIFVYLIILLITAGGNKVLAFVRNFAKILGVAILAVLIVFLTLILPPKRDENALLNALGGRLGVDAAASSRLNQIKPLTQEILKSPLIGFGFGKTITYRSNDPRVTPITAGGSGEITTYAFEWGYLDMILKFGVVGILVYLFLIFTILKRLVNVKAQNSNVKSMTNDQGQKDCLLRFGFILSLLAVLTINIFSPYLNHPLGIGFIIIVICYINTKI